MESRRNVGLDRPLQQKLCLIPLALATTDLALHSTIKAEVALMLEADATNKKLPNSKLKTCTIIEGMAHIRLMGKTYTLFTFGDYMDEFTRRITSRLYVEFGVCTRVDVLFDQYLDNSIKSGIRTKRPTTVCQV